MKVTRRGIVQALAISAALPRTGSAQDRTATVAPSAADALGTAREDYRAAGRTLGMIKIPRSVEPAARFEA
jgi:hypothetical protein